MMRDEDKRLVWRVSAVGFLVLFGFLTTSFLAWAVFGLKIPFYEPMPLYTVLIAVCYVFGAVIFLAPGWRTVGEEEES